MGHNLSSGKVIYLKKRAHARKMEVVRGQKQILNAGVRVVSIASGKGGVGKTSIALNLGYALSRQGKRVLILDAALGLGNLDVVMGAAPTYNISHVLSGSKTLKEIMIEGPGAIHLLPAASGIEELTRATPEQLEIVFDALKSLMNEYDILIIDTAAGISEGMACFNAFSHDVMVVVFPEPASITDAYALMKVNSIAYGVNRFGLVVNGAASFPEALDIFRQLKLVTDRFLSIRLEFSGHVLFDEQMIRCIKRQKIVTRENPESRVSRCLFNLADKIARSGPARPVHSKTGFQI